MVPAGLYNNEEKMLFDLKVFLEQVTKFAEEHPEMLVEQVCPQVICHLDILDSSYLFEDSPGSCIEDAEMVWNLSMRAFAKMLGELYESSLASN